MTASPSSATEPGAGRIDRRRLAGRIGIGLGLAALVLTGLALFADARQLWASLRGFPLWRLGVILALTLGNYALRFVKWHVYLRAIEAPTLPARTSALVFLSGFSMALTPGKVGEVIKAVYLRRLTGFPVSRTGAVIAAERITDGLAMLALAGIGLTQFSYGRPFLAVAAVGALALVLLLQRPTLLPIVVGPLRRWPIGRRLEEHAVGFLGASNVLYRPRLLVGAVALGVVSWACECVAFYLVLTGLDIPPSWRLLLVATFTLSASSIFGALSMLPGGLGVAEASVTGILLLLVTDPEMTRSTAVAATLLIRFATLWFGVLLGVAALGVIQRLPAIRPAREGQRTTGPFWEEASEAT